MEHDKSSRVCTCDGATKLQIRSVTSPQCASTQMTIIPVLGMAAIVFPQRILSGFLSENLAMFGK